MAFQVICSKTQGFKCTCKYWLSSLHSSHHLLLSPLLSLLQLQWLPWLYLIFQSLEVLSLGLCPWYSICLDCLHSRHLELTLLLPSDLDVFSSVRRRTILLKLQHIWHTCTFSTSLLCFISIVFITIIHNLLILFSFYFLTSVWAHGVLFLSVV